MMLALTGWLALAQALLLPGSLILLLTMPRARPWHWTLLAPPLSLLANFWLVLALVLLGLYTRSTLAALLVVEVAALAWLVWRRGPSLPATLAVIAALAALGVALAVGVAQDTSIFRAADAIVSWNRWAADWAAGTLPARILDYPQLLPAAASVAYAWHGTVDVQLFAKAVTMAAPAMLLGCGVALVAVGRHAAGIAALVLFGALAPTVSHRLFTGTADMPVAALTVAALVAAWLGRDSDDRRLVLLGAAVAATAALTKQAGLAVALVYPLLVPRELRLRTAVTILVLAGPWYVWQYALILAGAERWLVPAFVDTDVHRGRALLDRPAHAVAMLRDLLPWPWLLATVAGLVGALRQRFWQLAVGLLALPYAVAWVFLWSYDERNLLPVLAVLTLAAGAGYGHLASRLPVGAWPWRWAGFAGLLILVGGAVYGLVGSPFFRTDSRLLAEQRAAQEEIGDPALNRALADYFADAGARPVLVTAYHFAHYVPSLRHLVIEQTFFRGDGALLKAKLERLPDAYVLQYRLRVSPAVRAQLDEMVAQGRYVELFRTADGSRLLRPTR
ncbi:MAG: hypothetical protein RIM84_06140 [Alphaproteobacteria bacterium]